MQGTELPTGSRNRGRSPGARSRAPQPQFGPARPPRALVEEGTRCLRDLLARRTGRSPRDAAVRSLAGAVVGVCVRALADGADRPGTDPRDAVDEALGSLRAGLEL
ncbi:hypothetical protein [Nocardiopsis sp. YSL2]|uniref:acyl-CoA-like ligand-binding transcription factor n=1 Tax=Nocardiopsis sp. YSL2 TaxID=2939492 RepID=UPI0026F474EA|nr:hypothetical protein [Nocardiopsis sp. YSL2]